VRRGRIVFAWVVTGCVGYACGGGLPLDGADAGDAADDPVIDEAVTDATMDTSLDTSEETQPIDATPDASDDGDATLGSDATMDAVADVANEDATLDSSPDVNDASTFDSSLDGALLDGGTLTLLASNQNVPLVVTVDGTNVYWTNRASSGGVMQCAKNGCNGTPLTLGTLVNPVGITVDSTSVYVAAAGTGNADGEVAKFAIGVSNQTPTLLAYQQKSPTMIGTDGTDLFWTDNNPGHVFTCPNSGCPNLTPTVLVASPSAYGLALDSTNVYWSTASAHTVESIAKTSDAGVATSIATGLNSSYWIAVDSNNIYISDLGAQVLYECPKTGCAGNPTILANMPGLTGVASDGTNVYFGASAGLMKCAVGGCNKNPTTLASAHPMSVAVDSTSVYWSDETTNEVVKFTPK
jgi:hypothetical protein